MLKKIFALLSILFVIQSFAEAKESKTYTIAINQNYYHYISKNKSTNELEGIIIDWWKLWAKKTGVNVRFIPLELENCIQKTVSGEIDIIGGLYYSEKRGETLDFADPFIRMKTVLFLKKNIKPDSLQQIKDTIGLLKDQVSYSYLKEKYPDLNIKIYNSYALLKEDIKNKSIAGFVYDIPNPISHYKKPISPRGYYQFQILYAEKLRAAVKSGNSKMLNIVVSGSESMTEEEISAIAQQWDYFKFDKSLFWLLVIFGIGIGLFIAVFISFYYRKKRKNKQTEDIASKTNWQDIIEKGENDSIEFKSSLRWDYRLEKVNKVLEKVIAKTISAFLNTTGGLLFIGVDDDGNILGLENDYSCLSKKNRDGFMLTLTNLINVYLGKSNHKFVSINIISINEKDVCIVNIEKSDMPVFMGKDDNEEFYIRASASSQPLGIKESNKYINSHWK